MDGLILRVQIRWTDELGKEIIETRDGLYRVPLSKYYRLLDRDQSKKGNLGGGVIAFIRESFRAF